MSPDRRTPVGPTRIDWQTWHARHNHPGRQLPVVRTVPHRHGPHHPLPYDGPYYDGPTYEIPVYVEPRQVEVPYYDSVVPQSERVVGQAEEPLDPYTPRSVAFGKAVEAFFAGKFRDARALFSEAVTADPEDAEAWMGWVHTSILLERFDDAAEGITRVAARGGFPRGYRFDPRELFEDPRVYDNAIHQLSRYAARYPRDREALTVMAWWQVATGQHTLADASLSRIKWFDRDNVAVPYLREANRPVEVVLPRR